MISNSLCLLLLICLDGVRYHLDGSMESISVDDDGDCLQTMQLNSTSMNTDMYFLKEMNYNLLVIFVSFSNIFWWNFMMYS